MLTRRVLCRFLFTALGFAATGKRMRGAVAPSLGVDSLLVESEIPLPAAAIRTYRADVVITLLGMPVFVRKGVGSAFAAIREAAEEQTKVTALQFAGGANSERSHGVRCQGSIEEVVVEDRLSRAAYFGFVTRSTDESYDQARRRILNGPQGAGTYVVVAGFHSAGSARSERAVISLPDQCRRGLSELVEQIRARFHTTDRIAAELHTPGVAAPGTFLYSVLLGLRSGAARFQNDYVHNARKYGLDLERTADQPGPLTRFTGRVRDLSTQKVSIFWLWLDVRSCLPVRIEFHPRSYLRVTLQHQPDGASQNA